MQIENKNIYNLSRNRKEYKKKEYIFSDLDNGILSDNTNSNFDNKPKESKQYFSNLKKSKTEIEADDNSKSDDLYKYIKLYNNLSNEVMIEEDEVKRVKVDVKV